MATETPNNDRIQMTEMERKAAGTAAKQARQSVGEMAVRARMTDGDGAATEVAMARQQTISGQE